MKYISLLLWLMVISAIPARSVEHRVVASFNEKHYRFRNDDGSETTATWKAAQDTNITLANTGGNITLRLRMGYDVGAGPSTVGRQLGLTVNRNGGGANTITSSSSYVVGATTGNLTDQAATTNQLTVPGGDLFRSLTGTVADNTAATCGNGTTTIASMSTLNGDWTESEWMLTIKGAQLNAGDTLVFAISVLNGTDNSSMAHTVQVTISGSTRRSGREWEY